MRDLNSEDIDKRKLSKGLKGSVILSIENKSPLNGLLNINDVIIEIQKKPVLLSKNLDKLVTEVKKSGQPLYLTIINKENRRRYLGIKLK